MGVRDLVEIYRAKNSTQAHLLKSALEREGIFAIIEGDLLQSALGELPVGWSSAPRIMVQSPDAVRAREIMENYEGASEEPEDDPR